MHVLDFATQEQIEDLPEDPDEAFVALVRIAQQKLSEVEKDNSDDDQDSWRVLEESRHSFTNFVLAAGKHFRIQPFVDMDVPVRANFDDRVYQQFKEDLDHYVIQIVLGTGIRTKRDSVPIEPEAKEKIRNYIHAIKQCIDRADLTESKRSKLHDQLAKFEGELEKKRLSVLAVARLAIEIVALPGAVWASSEVATRLVTNVLQVVGESKTLDEENRQLPSIDAPVALLAPRGAEPKPPPADRDDDEIPF